MLLELNKKIEQSEEDDFSMHKIHLRIFVPGNSTKDKFTGITTKSSSQSYFKTKKGNINEDDWYKEALDIIKKHGEEYILEALKDNERKCVSYYKGNEKKILEHALELHISRIFEDHEWVDYEEFNTKLEAIKNSRISNNDCEANTSSENFSSKIEKIKEELKIISKKSDKFNIELDDILK